MSELKILKYFDNLKHNSVGSCAFAELWRGLTTLDWEIPSSPDTLRVLLTGFASMAWSTASESTYWGRCNLSKISSTIWLLYCASTFCTTDFGSILSQLELDFKNFL